MEALKLLPVTIADGGRIRSPTFAEQARAAAGAFDAPSAQTLASPRAPRVGTKLAQAVEMLGATEGATIAELSEALDWLPHTTRAALTGLRKRGYALTLDRSDAGRGSAYRIGGAANAPHDGTAPMEPDTSVSDAADGAGPRVSFHLACGGLRYSFFDDADGASIDVRTQAHIHQPL